MEQLVKKYIELVGREEISKQFSERLYKMLGESLPENERVTVIDFALPLNFVNNLYDLVLKPLGHAKDSEYGMHYIYQNLTGVGYNSSANSFGTVLPLNDQGSYLLESYYRKL